MANSITSIASLHDALELASNSAFLRKCDYVLEIELSSVFGKNSFTREIGSALKDEADKALWDTDHGKVYLLLYDLKIPALGITYSAGQGLSSSEAHIQSGSNLSIGYYSTYTNFDMAVLASKHNDPNFNIFVPWEDRPNVNIYLAGTLMYRFEHCLFNIPRPEIDVRSSDISATTMEIAYEYYKVCTPQKFTPLD